ncbi:hypothetical protein PHMEG_00023802 [Phytophthora megakarya]|uniref:FYVE-type domain-containing protein n=1 Tax=Phytophthora megakarya TaxID=4795 RepID=A0A225VG42_9STRA|nr:hypothetical protein PHMEG_00023802 [Phytophthora megakarya]
MSESLSAQHQSPASEATRRATAPEELQEVLHQAKYSTTSVEAPKEVPMMELPEGEAQAYRHLAHSIVSRTLAHEMEYHRMKRPEFSQRDWKLLKRQNDLNIYKRRSQESSRAVRPMVVCVGSIAGELEDVLYGLHAKTREEMLLTLPFRSKGFVDCAMLAKMDGATPADPYRLLALKWHCTDVLSGSNLMKIRDLCKIESMGMSTDAQGERYGYYLLQSVDFPGCPPPPESSDVIRANMMFCCIYRQVPGSHVVDVYAKGMYDLGGDIPSFLVYNTSSSLMLSTIIGNMECAEAKRLTLLALLRSEGTMHSSVEDLSAIELEEFELTGDPAQYSNSASGISTEMTAAIAAMPPSLTRLISKNHRKSRSRRQTSAEPCCVCEKKPMASIVGATHRTCGVCLRGVCNKCHVKRKLFSQPKSVTVACCKSCLLEAKHLSVNPQDQCPVLP